MELNDYLVKNESATASVTAFDSVDAISDSKEGTLACTPHRVVYVRGKDVTDISLNGVNSIEYTSPSYPKRYLMMGIGIAAGSLLLIVLGAIFGEIPDAGVFSALFFVLGIPGFIYGIVVLGYGFLLRRAVLRVHTPNKSYEFSSKDTNLDQIGHTIRGYEMRKNSR
ncbi:hypothetical protein [Haloprofundus salilacus]|uniref:hypothetical protein n=1 Tax=Haloprofundus salilacus TaxID=2876190 RepID=UPI001CCF6838|nr:hypothetical protein [Haloprofundus salilacus]